MAAPGAAALSAEERFSQSTSEYTSKDIQVLEGIQAIRHRPAMYIGSTGTSGLVHLIWEALDNSVDEAVAGYGNQIWVDVDREGVVGVLDEGRGMPFDLMTYHGKKLPSATVLLTVPHSGGKFAEGAYKTAGGLHGVGATVINALSEWLELNIWRDGFGNLFFLVRMRLVLGRRRRAAVVMPLPRPDEAAADLPVRAPAQRTS